MLDHLNEESIELDSGIEFKEETPKIIKKVKINVSKQYTDEIKTPTETKMQSLEMGSTKARSVQVRISSSRENLQTNL